MGNVQVMLKIKNPSILKTLIVILSELPLKKRMSDSQWYP